MFLHLWVAGRAGADRGDESPDHRHKGQTTIHAHTHIQGQLGGTDRPVHAFGGGTFLLGDHAPNHHTTVLHWFHEFSHVLFGLEVFQVVVGGLGKTLMSISKMDQSPALGRTHESCRFHGVNRQKRNRNC